jgi:hypothetical protein
MADPHNAETAIQSAILSELGSLGSASGFCLESPSRSCYSAHMSTLQFVTLADRPDLFEPLDELVTKVWPEFMLHDPVAGRLFMRMVRGFPDFQLVALEDGEIVGGANSVRFALDGPIAGLPEGGWDWMLEKAIADLDAGKAPDALCGMQVAVRTDRQGRRYSGLILAELKRRAVLAGHRAMVVPVRPNWKARYPLIPIDDYITWQTAEGLPFDPWLRVHARLGGRIVKACHQAMRISGTITEWEAWTGMGFPGSGRHIVPGALVPVEVAVAADTALYVEPNVWVEHPLA